MVSDYLDDLELSVRDKGILRKAGISTEEQFLATDFHRLVMTQKMRKELIALQQKGRAARTMRLRDLTVRKAAQAIRVLNDLSFELAKENLFIIQDHHNRFRLGRYVTKEDFSV